MMTAWCRKSLLIGATALTMSGILLTARDGSQSPPSRGVDSQEGGAQGEPGKGNRPPKPPLEIVLDANGDGVIDADEIAAAATALKKLDKNGDGRLTPEEYRPPHPPRQGGQAPGDQGHPGGEGPGQGDAPTE